LARSQEAVTIARAVAHPFSLAHALGFAAFVCHLRGEQQATHKYATAAITVSTEAGFTYWLALGTMLRGWALAEEGEHDEGRSTFLRGLTINRAAGTRVGEPYYLAMLAGMYGKEGEIAKGLTTLTEALTFGDAYGIGFSTAELFRLKGELTLQQGKVKSEK